MPTPATVDDLLKLIRKSGMIEEPRLDAYLERLRLQGPLTGDVRKLAGGMVRDGLLTYFQAEQFMLGKWRGFTIGKYKLLERVGFGGMGQVFLCEHMYMRRRVAIKVLPPAKAEEPAALGRFYREARAAAALDHPNIVRTHDIDQDGNLHFLVMEYVDGSSLLEIIKKKGQMPIGRAAQYIWQAAQGLDHACKVGIIHRDIKPGNILVDRQGVSKILDMGLARFYHNDDDMLTKKYDEKSVLGTADYVAPEQTINSHDVDVRADIYSLGATFYFLLVGQPPFPEGTISQKLIAHQTRQPKPIRVARPEVPPELAAVIEKMMAKSLRDRFQTPADVTEALARFVPAQVDAPPEDEMPVLSPAAREVAAQPVTAPGSGTMKQDSALVAAAAVVTRPAAAPPRPTPVVKSGGGVAVVPPPPRTGGPGRGSNQGGNSGSVRPGYEPPAVSPLGSAAHPPIPNPTRPANETARMAEETDRAPVARAPVPRAPAARGPVRRKPRPEERREPEHHGMNPVLKIILESIAVFGVCLLIYVIIRNLT
jgi:eukaryotic-like serine/threonine-protein kinase